MLDTTRATVESVIVIVVVGASLHYLAGFDWHLGSPDRGRRVRRAPVAPPQRNADAPEEAAAEWRRVMIGAAPSRSRPDGGGQALESCSRRAFLNARFAAW